MKEFIGLLVVAVDIVNGFPTLGSQSHRRVLRGLEWYPSDGFSTDGLAGTTPSATGSGAAGSVISGSPSHDLPTGATPWRSSFQGFNTSAFSTSYSSTKTPESGSGANFTPTTSTSILSTFSSATGVSSVQSARPSDIDSPGTGSLGAGSPDTGSPGTGVPGLRPPSTGTPGTGLFPTGVPINTPFPGSASVSNSPTGTITAGSLSTIQISSLSTQSTSIEGITVNTELTTEDGNGHHTVVPFLFGCWFCGGGGMILWGIGPNPGVYPPPNPPPFPSWPTITIGNDDIPTVKPPENKPTDISPTKNGPTDTQSTKSATDTTSSSSCTSSTVTDYWVSCASAVSSATSSCSTYSTSLVTGCNVKASTTTAESSCTTPTNDPANPLLEESLDPDLWYLDPATIQAILRSASSKSSTTSGILNPPPGPVTTSEAANNATSISTTHTPGVPSTSTGLTTPSSPPLCNSFQDPHNGDRGHCQCSSGSFTTTLPFQTGVENPQGDLCGYTTLVVPSPTTKPQAVTSASPFAFTTTDIYKNIIACESTSSIPIPGNRAATYCAGSRSTISTGSPTTKPTPSPEPLLPLLSADCSFRDEGLWWKFEIHNIRGWSTDGGKRLHHEEDGCGALTGWSWADDKTSFNLPFFIKDGCVERAIVSAGGPKISCKGRGLGKQALSITGTKSSTDVVAPDGGPPNFNNATVAKAYNPSDVDTSDVSHIYNPATWDNTIRSLVGPRYPINKRTCGHDYGDICGPVIPGVDECRVKIREHGKVGPRSSTFYSSFHLGRGGIPTRKFSRPFFRVADIDNDKVVDDTELCDPYWKFAVRNVVANAFIPDGKDPSELTDAEQQQREDKYLPFLANLSQAYAELSEGDAYVMVPGGQLPGNVWDRNTVWGGWEYPALSKNEKVRRLYRVDTDEEKHKFSAPHVVWDRDNGDYVPTYEPKGIRERSLPEGLPSDQIPDCWYH